MLCFGALIYERITLKTDLNKKEAISMIIADIIYIPLFIYKGLYITSLQYVVFLYLAIRGYDEWKKEKFQ